MIHCKILECTKIVESPQQQEEIATILSSLMFFKLIGSEAYFHRFLYLGTISIVMKDRLMMGIKIYI